MENGQNKLVKQARSNWKMRKIKFEFSFKNRQKSTQPHGKIQWAKSNQKMILINLEYGPNQEKERGGNQF